MTFIRKIDEALSAVERVLVIVLFAALVAAIGVNVLSRNFFHRSFQNLLEYAPAIVLWLALMGSTLGLRQQRHIRLELLLRLAPPKLRRPAQRAGALFGAAVTGLLAAVSVSFVQNEVAIFGGAGWLAVVFPVFFTLAAFRFLLSVFPPPGAPGDPAGGDRS